MASNTQAVAVPDNGAMIRRRPVWRVGGLLAQSASGLVNIPGLKDTVLFVKEGAKALKAPKLNDAQTRKQIDSINRLLNRVESVNAAVGSKLDLLESCSPAQGEPDEVKAFQRHMMGFKSELERNLDEKYSIKLARQGDIAQFLTQKNEQLSKCVAEFCVDGSVHAHRAAQMQMEYNQQIQAFSVLLVEQSKRTTNLEYQIQTLQYLLWGCLAFF